MVYSLKNTRNTEVDTVADNILKTTSFGIRVPGKNFAGYGEAIGQTLLHMLENFACPNNGSDLPNPTNSAVNLTSPALGQLWFDTTNLTVRVWDGTAWSIISSSSGASGTTPPGTPLEGDLWWNSTTNQLFVYDGANWILIAPMSDSTDLVFSRALKINSGGTGGQGAGDAAAPSSGTTTDAMGTWINNVLIGIWSSVQVLTPTFYFVELNDDSGNVRYYSVAPFDGQIEPGLNILAAAGTYFNGRSKIADSADAAASGDVTVIDSGAFYTASNVEAVLQEIGNSLVAIGAGSVADADYGDITVSGTGTIWTIDPFVVDAGKLASNSVTTAKIVDGDVTLAKIQNLTTDRLLGRETAGSGPVEQLTIGAGLTLAAGELSATNPFGQQLFHVRDEKGFGTDGGTFTNGAWRTRDLTTILTNEISGASRSGNQLILPDGTYYIEASAPADRVNDHRARFENVSLGSTMVIGTNTRAADSTGGDGTRATVKGRFTSSGGPHTFELQHRCVESRSINGFGLAFNVSGINEVYTEVLIWKIT